MHRRLRRRCAADAWRKGSQVLDSDQVRTGTVSRMLANVFSSDKNQHMGICIV